MGKRKGSSSMTQSVFLEIKNAIAIVTLNEAETLNALTEEMLAALIDILNQCEDNPEINAMIITGAGRGFCAGANLKSSIVDMRTGSFERWIKDHLNPLVVRLQSSRLPIIAAINGPAAGAGVSLALGCDLILAADTAKFVIGFAKIGVGMDLGASWTLPRAIGMKRTKQLAMLSRPLDANTAKDWGLVMDVFPNEELLTAAENLCAELLVNSTPPAIAAIKQQLKLAANTDLHGALEFEAQIQAALVLTEESKQLIDSFGN
ncbi:enoyl-CoA hydratase-related protein [Hyphomonas sp. FCG-A18]|uniref:enoyl-CoA hydratase/isomerase family protein n=1 Tax=Hyphomonas sp. FCG-A18 TaxID=3080019 RepID=UPI002B2ED3EE|nr:enoyl-CoA hydratase-related protein [Hyphomonas sp. FCG-A18]